eukprot:EG_transcript_52287
MPQQGLEAKRIQAGVCKAWTAQCLGQLNKGNCSTAAYTTAPQSIRLWKPFTISSWNFLKYAVRVSCPSSGSWNFMSDSPLNSLAREFLILFHVMGLSTDVSCTAFRARS